MLDSLGNRWKLLFKEMTIEPAMMIQMIGLGVSSVVGDTMFIERVCRITLKNSDSVCTNLTAYKSIETEASSLVSIYQMYGTIIQSGFPLLFAFFLGSWIDRHGTKIPMLFSVFGYICSNLFAILLAIKSDWSPWILLFGTMPSSLTGGVTVFMMTVLTFISRRTNEENRSFRIGVMESGWFIGYSSGVQIGSQIFAAYGYVPVFLTASCFVSLAFIYLLIFLKEESICVMNVEGSEELKPSRYSMLTDVFQISSIKQTFHTCFKKRISSRRMWLLLLVSMMCLRVLAQDGVVCLTYLYTRAKFGWDNSSYSTFVQIEVIIRFLGLLIMIGALNALHWKDTGLGIFSSFGYIVAHLTFAFAQKGWMMYLGGAIQTPCVLITILIRSAISKLVDKDELGRIFSVVAIGEACVPLMASLIFNPIFAATVHSLPGTIFIVAAAIHGVICIQFVYLFFAMDKLKTSDSKEPLNSF